MPTDNLLKKKLEPELQKYLKKSLELPTGTSGLLLVFNINIKSINHLFSLKNNVQS